MKTLRKLFEAVGALGGFALFAMSILVTTDVFYRFISNRTITGVYEMCEIGFLVSVFCAMPVTQNRNKAIRIDIVQTKIKKGRFFYILEVVNNLFCLFFFGVVVYLGFDKYAKAVEGHLTRGGIINIPLAIPYAFMIVGSILTLLSLLLNTVIAVSGIGSPQKALAMQNTMRGETSPVSEEIPAEAIAEAKLQEKGKEA